MRMRRRVLAMTGVLLVLSAVWAPAAGASGSVTVTPSTGLVDLQVVTVDGSGFNPGQLIGVCETLDLGAPRGVDQCSSGTLQTISSSPGSFSLEFTVRRFLYIPRIDRIIDCARPGAGCVIATAEASDIDGTFVLVPISFASAPPPPVGAITVTPNSDLLRNQTVRVTGSAFGANVPVLLRECVASVADTSGCGPSQLTTSDAGGGFVYNGFPVVTPIGTASCAGPGTCEIRAYQDGTAATAPLSFRTFQPDGQIKRFFFPNATPLSNDIYNLDASGQRQIRPVAPGGKQFFPLLIQNDGIQTDDIKVTGQGSSSLFTVRYFVGYYDVTSHVTGGGFTFTGLAPNSIASMAVSVEADATAPANATKNVLVTSTSVGDPTKQDVVQVGVVVSGGCAQCATASGTN